MSEDEKIRNSAVASVWDSLSQPSSKPAEPAIVSIDEVGVIRTWSRSAKDLTGYDFREVSGKSLSCLSPLSAGFAVPLDTMLDLARRNGRFVGRDRIQKCDGSLLRSQWTFIHHVLEETGSDGFTCLIEPVTAGLTPLFSHSLPHQLRLLTVAAEDVESLVQEVTRLIASALDWPLAHAYFYDPTACLLRSSKSWHDLGFPDQFAEFRRASESMEFQSGIGLPGRVHATKEAVLITDIANDDNFPRKSYLYQLPIRSALGIPVIVDGSVVASLEFFTEAEAIDAEVVSYVGDAVGHMIEEFIRRKRQADEQEFFFEMSLDLLCLVGYDGYFKRVNPSWTKILGYSVAEVLQSPWPNFVHPDDLPAAIEAGQGQVLEGKTVTIELRFRHKDGGYRWLEWYSVPRPDREMIYAIGRDITEKRHSDEQMQRTISLQNAILNGSDYGIICVDLNGKVTVFNQGAERMMGYQAREFIGQDKPPRLTDPSCLEERAKDLSKVIGKSVQANVDGFLELAKLRTHHQFEWTYVRKDGTKFPALLEISGLRNEKGELTGYTGIIQDISKRREAEMARQRLSAIIEVSPDLIGFADEDGQILYQNAGGNRMLGIPDHVDPNDFSGPDTPTWANQIDWGKILYDIQTVGFWRGESVLRHVDGHDIPVSQVLVRLPSAGDRNYLATIIRDISDMKFAESRLAKNALELKHSNEELEQFAYVASHDLQEPLRMVCSFLGLLELEFGDQLTEDAREYIQYAVDGGMRMRALIDGLLDFSRVGRQVIELNRVDTEHIFDEVAFNLQLAINEARAEITYDPLPAVMGDHVSLARLFQNLISNSLKFRGDAPVHIHIGAESHDDIVEFSIADNGIGIDPRHSEKIFLIFQRLHPKSEYPGSGIGLSICKKIVERHGGQLWLDTEYSGGARFKFTLPKAK